MTFLNARFQSRHDANRLLIESLERRLHDMETSLQTETAARRELEEEMKKVREAAHAAQAEAWKRHDRAQLIVAQSMTHIERLERHIEAGSPPPPPPLPPELQAIKDNLMWSRSHDQTSTDKKKGVGDAATQA
nr:MAG TPA: anaphase-promoting complex subunit 10 [Caudoviricetes sp.]